MASTPSLPPQRHVEFKKGGWGAALLTVVATAAVFLTAFYIHTKTYRDPTDVMMQAVGDNRGHGASTEHGAAPAAGASHEGTTHEGSAPAAAAPAAAPTTPPAGH